MQKPPLIVATASILYLTGALSVLWSTNAADPIGIAVSIWLLAIGTGLWFLKEWARLAEICFGILQAAIATFFLAKWIFVDDSAVVETLWTVLLFLLMAATNMAFVYYFSTKKVRQIFMENQQVKKTNTQPKR